MHNISCRYYYELRIIITIVKLLLCIESGRYCTRDKIYKRTTTIIIWYKCDYKGVLVMFFVNTL